MDVPTVSYDKVNNYIVRWFVNLTEINQFKHEKVQNK